MIAPTTNQFHIRQKKILSKILNKPKTGQYINMDRITKIDIFKQETHWSTIIE